MSEQIKKGLKKIWSAEPVTFPGFSHGKQVEVEKLLEQMPSRFDKKPEYMMMEPLSTKKSYGIKDREKSENANLLYLNSGDNDKAECLATYVEDHHKRSIDWVSLTI